MPLLMPLPFIQDLPELRDRPYEERRRLILLARARRGDAIWVLPLLAGVLALAFATGAGWLAIRALIVMGGRGAGAGASPATGLLGCALAFGVPAMIAAFVLTRRVLIVRTLQRLLVRTACPHCGFDLRGLNVEYGAVRCPECGARVVLHEAGIHEHELRSGREERPLGAGPMGAHAGMRPPGRHGTGR